MKTRKVNLWLSGILVFSIGSISGYTYLYSPERQLSELALENVEALARSEGSGSKLKCYKTVHGDSNKTQTHYTYCGTCSPTKGYDAENQSYCYE